MKNRILFVVIIVSLFYSDFLAQCVNHDSDDSTCTHECCNSKISDGIAPMGLMGDHTHHKKGLMFSYRMMNMSMRDNLSGIDKVSNSQIFENYMMAPQDMNMQMHMMGVMYGLTDRVTLMGMLNYHRNKMSMIMMNGNEHQHESKGVGDVKISAIMNIWKNKNQTINANLGLNIPTGKVGLSEVSHVMHHGHMTETKTVLPYPMQLGSGSFDVFLGATYLAKWDKITFGFQSYNNIRTAKNNRGYRFGNQYSLNAWSSYRINSWISFSIRGEGEKNQKIEGVDNDVLAMRSPPTNVFNSGKELIRAYGGVNLYFANFWKGVHFGFEFGAPIYQNVEGVQMKENNILTVGLRFDVL